MFRKVGFKIIFQLFFNNRDSPINLVKMLIFSKINFNYVTIITSKNHLLSTFVIILNIEII